MHMFGRLAPVLAALLLLSACAGGGLGARPSLAVIYGRQDARPTSLGELQNYLTAELARLGKSASATEASAPTGEQNAVFDLAASIVDPDGPPDGIGGGELPPTGVALAWTERLLGDYDMNGQVNVPDLVPLASHWLGAVGYDAAALHGGIAYWPAGGADDDGGSAYPAPPAAGSGAANWRLARTDGDGNGQLYFGDVTTIAQHWKEQSSGYRVYVKLPGATEYQLLPGDGGAPVPPAPGLLTLARSAAYPTGATQPDPARPLRFHLSYGDEATPLPEGHYAFYVAAYDATTDAEGPACSAVEFDITGGVLNQLPQARLSLSPNFAGAPAVISFDASASTDADGSIVEYRWDFDADGVVDWSTADASVPEKSSGGEVDTITPGEAPGLGLPPATVTVTYHQGYGHYLYPRVTVVDDGGAAVQQPVKLGISGWKKEILSSYDPANDPPGFELLYSPTTMSVDPATGEVCCAGDAQYSGWFGPKLPEGLYFSRRQGPGAWEQELVCDLATPALAEWGGTPSTAFLAWQANGQPVILFMGIKALAMDKLTRVCLAERQADGTWQTQVWFRGAAPDNSSGGPLASWFRYLGPGKFGAVGTDYDGGQKVYYYDYDDGPQPPEYTGLLYHMGDNTATDLVIDLTFDRTGTPYIVITGDPSSKLDVWWARRTGPGVWVRECAGLAPASPAYVLFGADNVCFDIHNEPVFLGITGTADNDYWITVGRTPPNLTLTALHHSNTIDGQNDCLASTAGISLFSTPEPSWNGEPTDGATHDLITPEGIISEQVHKFVTSDPDYQIAQYRCTGADVQGHIYTILYAMGGDLPPGVGKTFQVLGIRVDPRIP